MQNFAQQMQRIRRMVLNAMLAALYVVLTLCTIPVPLGANTRLTLGSLPVVLGALLFGPVDSCCIAFVGEAINQIKYGLTVTTPLWVIPPLLRGLVIGLVAAQFKKKGQLLEDHAPAYFFTLILAALSTTLGNTAVIYLDAYIYGYPAVYTAYETFTRFVLGMLTAIVVALLALPVTKAVRRIAVK